MASTYEEEDPSFLEKCSRMLRLSTGSASNQEQREPVYKITISFGSILPIENGVQIAAHWKVTPDPKENLIISLSTDCTPELNVNCVTNADETNPEMIYHKQIVHLLCWGSGLCHFIIKPYEETFKLFGKEASHVFTLQSGFSQYVTLNSKLKCPDLIYKVIKINGRNKKQKRILHLCEHGIKNIRTDGKVSTMTPWGSIFSMNITESQIVRIVYTSEKERTYDFVEMASAFIETAVQLSDFLGHSIKT